MASKGELYNQINGYQIRVEECSREIDEEKKRIEELYELLRKLGTVNLNFNTAQYSCRQRLYSMASFFSSMRRISSKIVASYERNMSHLLTGGEYQKVAAGLETAQSAVRDEIQKRERRIDELQGEIRNLQNQIGACRTEIAEIERREREERERREREEREARERAAIAAGQEERRC